MIKEHETIDSIEKLEDAIKKVVKVNEDDYTRLKENNKNDPYLNSFNIQQQRKE